MINLCLVVIATQFSETKKREMERMRLERARYQSTSTLASTSASESQSCYKQIIKYIAHLWRRSKRRLLRRYRAYRNRKRHDNVPRPLSLRKRTGRPKTSSAGQSCHVMIFLRFSLKCSSLTACLMPKTSVSIIWCGCDERQPTTPLLNRFVGLTTHKWHSFNC